MYSQTPLKALFVYKGDWRLDSLAGNRASGHGPLTQCEEDLQQRASITDGDMGEREGEKS